MSILDFDAELVKAGATAHTRLARLRHLIWRNPLGAAGGIGERKATLAATDVGEEGQAHYMSPDR